MKPLLTFSAVLGALCLAAPVTGWSKDKDRHDHDHHDWSHDHGSHNYYDHRPSVIVRSYPSYPYYGYPYASYPAYSYYSGPSVSFNYRSAPRTDNYDDDLAVDVQRALARRGFYHGAIDGDVGPGTRGAIREYQYRNRLEVTGRIDRTLLRSLNVD
jgi:hypothetical protein